MRQQQQRSRNRNRGRKSSNPLSRNFESNGPDVKIRGNANHIAEKYNVLARDALTSGDTVMAENYFQHAEHYFRIIAASQQNNPQAGVQNNSHRENGRASNSTQGDDATSNEASEVNEKSRGDGPQPELDTVPAEVILKEEKSAINKTQSSNDGEEAVPETADKMERGRASRNGRKPVAARRNSRDVSKKAKESSTSQEVSTEGVSEDAALLPSSLIGTAMENESDNEPPPVKE